MRVNLLASREIAEPLRGHDTCHWSAGLRHGAFALARTRNAGSETGAPPVDIPVGGSVKVRPLLRLLRLLRFTPLASVGTLARIAPFYNSRFARARDVAIGNFGVRNANASPETDPVYEVISRRQEE